MDEDEDEHEEDHSVFNLSTDVRVVQKSDDHESLLIYEEKNLV